MASWQMMEGMIGNRDSHKTTAGRAPEPRLIFNIFAKLRELREEKKLCDLIFKVGKSQYPTHKAVLAAWSPKIASLILSQKDLRADHVVNVHYDNTSVFSEFMEYCYSGLIVITELNVHSLLDIGNNFFVHSLVDACEDYLKSTLSRTNFVSRLITSVKYGLKSLEETSISYIESNLGSLVGEEELLHLRPQDFHVFLTAGKMKEVQVEIKLSLIINWVNFCQVDRNKLLLFLLSQLVWDDNVGEMLVQISCSENLFTSNELCLFQLLQCLVNSIGHNLGAFMAAYTRLYSIYSHMIEELMLPKCFSESMSKIENIVSIPMSVDCVASSRLESDTQIECQPQAVVKGIDAGVNTDVDSTYFSESNTSQQMDTSDVYTNNAAMSALAAASAFNDDNTDTENTTSMVIVKTEVPEEGNERYGQEQKHISKNPAKATKRKRKGNPRKIAVNLTENKPKRGRPKLNKVKDENESVKKSPVGNKTKPKKEKANTEEATADSQNDFTPILSDDMDKNEIELAKLAVANWENGDPDFTLSEVEKEVEEEEEDEWKPSIRVSLKKKTLKQTKGRKRTRKVKPKKISEDGTYIKPAPKKQINKYKCTYEGCDYTTRKEHRLERHIEIRHLIKIVIQCEKCDYSVDDMKDYIQHMRSHYDAPPYECDKPGCNQLFMRMCLLVRHEMTHREDKPYKCDLPMCNKTFACMSQLRVHRKMHEVGRQYECDVCHKKFTTKGVMQQHRVIHFKNKSYLCDWCGFCTKHQSHLISHRKIHTGNVLRCTMPNCNYSTPKQGHMTQHMNTHLNIRNHICQVCGKSFVVRGKLLRHERIHSKDKLFKCKQCDYKTIRLDRMKLHIESHGIRFKRRKWNVPFDEDEDIERDQIDFHQLYERIQPSENKSEEKTIQGITDVPVVSMTELKDIKPMDSISLAASTSMIMDDTYPTAKLMIDPITGEAVASIDDNLTFQQSFERIHTTGFDQL